MYCDVVSISIRDIIRFWEIGLRGVVVYGLICGRKV